MGLADKLERRAKELDGNLKGGEYDKQKYEDRELLEQAVQTIRHCMKIIFGVGEAVNDR